jgi:hypothetical protein
MFSLISLPVRSQQMTVFRVGVALAFYQPWK